MTRNSPRSPAAPNHSPHPHPSQSDRQQRGLADLVLVHGAERLKRHLPNPEVLHDDERANSQQGERAEGRRLTGNDHEEAPTENNMQAHLLERAFFQKGLLWKEPLEVNSSF